MLHRAKRISIPSVDPEVRAARNRLMAEREAKIEAQRIDDIAADRSSQFNQMRALLVGRLGDDLRQFLDIVQRTDAAALKNEILHIIRIEDARKLAAGRLTAAKAAAQ